MIEAKNADLERGFTQLAIELVAMAEYVTDESNLLYGAVTVGDVWRFGVLDRSRKMISKDIDVYRVPADLAELVGILVGTLEP